MPIDIYDECLIFIVTLNVVMPNVVILSVVAPNALKKFNKRTKLHIEIRKTSQESLTIIIWASYYWSINTLLYSFSFRVQIKKGTESLKTNKKIKRFSATNGHKTWGFSLSLFKKMSYNNLMIILNLS
jgi:hypothetical protein